MSYAIFLANEIKIFSKNSGIDLIASHGHTIFHEPEKNHITNWRWRKNS